MSQVGVETLATYTAVWEDNTNGRRLHDVDPGVRRF